MIAILLSQKRQNWALPFSNEGVLVLLEKRPENRQITESSEKL